MAFLFIFLFFEGIGYTDTFIHLLERKTQSLKRPNIYTDKTEIKLSIYICRILKEDTLLNECVALISGMSIMHL